MAFKPRNTKRVSQTQQKPILTLDEWREKYPDADDSGLFQVIRVKEWRNGGGFILECCAQPENFLVLEPKKAPLEFEVEEGEDDEEDVDFEKLFPQLVERGVALYVSIDFMGNGLWGENEDFSCLWKKAARGFIATPAQPVKK